MLLQINKRVFSLGDKYDILDGQGSPIFHVQGHPLSLIKKLELLDMNGTKLARIEQKLFSLVSEYHILQRDQVVAVVQKKLFSLLKPQFTVEGMSGTYVMEGDWLNCNYEISTSGRKVAQISHQLNFVQDSFGLEIVENADVPFLICLSIVINEVTHNRDWIPMP